MLPTPSPQPSPPPPSSSTTTSKFLIIILIITLAILASISLNILRHVISRRRPPSPPPTPPPPPPPPHQNRIFPPSPISAPHKAPDCAVCLSPFRPRDDLRLLPSCRHAFHLRCIDLWLQSTPSCPLCRSPADPASFHVDIDVELVVDDAEGSVDRVKEEEGEEGGQGWLGEYLDGMTSSGSTSFGSLAFSGRMSGHALDDGSIEVVVGGDDRSWEVEGVEWVEESGLAGIYRWFVGM